MANVITSNRTGFIRRAGRSTRQTMWVGLAETSTALAGAGSGVLFTGYSAAVLALRPFTIVRTRLLFHVASDQQAATEDYIAAIGMAIVTEQALAVGITAVPTPMVDNDSDAWFLWAASAGHFVFGTAVGMHQGGGAPQQVDSKAMRKVEDGFDVATVIENGGSPFLGSSVIKAGRQLIKLH